MKPKMNLPEYLKNFVDSYKACNILGGERGPRVGNVETFSTFAHKFN